MPRSQSILSNGAGLKRNPAPSRTDGLFTRPSNFGAEGEPNSRYVLKSMGSVAEGVLDYLKEEIIERNS